MMFASRHLGSDQYVLWSNVKLEFTGSACAWSIQYAWRVSDAGCNAILNERQCKLRAASMMQSVCQTNVCQF